ncbi:lipopolysaccharide transport periplasmic protein LptA [Mangrovicoccus algicola]|uniref:Lipopolysaccharide transport periplasmic protein LptA n=1 Tax=Mangrovicoccus algicola TaxID=2771008 RepID=A0A8J6YZW3_9RHOB|nr:lipopolysaccharide transport periplasmic protein LptA [Mangrovicoccus algicola]MBE3638948.1 lipopolysaccharide transport periplasmic protein LptA [Mangrovicoccus algicola]
MRQSLILTLMLAAAQALPGAALSQGTGVSLGGVAETDRDAPVEVTSDQLELDQTAGTALFTGDVLVVQGEMRLAAPRILVEYARLPDGSLGEDVDRITATGGVTMVTPDEAAEAEEAVYSPVTEEVVMTGDVLLTQGPNTLNGTRLVIDLATGTGRMEGRVRTVITPGTAPESAGQ